MSAPPSAPRSQYVDGEWHRLHPATPLLRGGIAIVVVLTYIANSFREQLINAALGRRADGDPIAELQRHHLIPVAVLITLGILLIAVALFWISWRASAFRIVDGSVTVRHGVLLRRVRTARLDRVQGVTIGRPLLARIVGAARIELDVAGHDANVRLEYLSGGAAEQLRRDVLVLAAGERRQEAAAAGTPVSPQDLSGVDEPGVRILGVSPGRAIGAGLFRESTVVLILLVVIGVPVLVSIHALPLLISFVPILLASVTLAARRIGRMMRFTIVGTSDGVRIGAGLLSTSNEAVPPGRIHAVRIEQPLLWRPLGWWRVTVNRAGRIAGRRNQELERMIAPVATRQEVLALLPFLIPNLTRRAELLDVGLVGRGAAAESPELNYVPAPRRARWLRPIAWRRTGFSLVDGAFLLRGGWFRRHLTLIPQARIQSVAILQGPAARLLGVAAVEAHTVHGPVRGRIDLVDARRALTLFDELAEAGQHARARDISHRWGETADALAALSRADAPALVAAE